MLRTEGGVAVPSGFMVDGPRGEFGQARQYDKTNESVCVLPKADRPAVRHTVRRGSGLGGRSSVADGRRRVGPYDDLFDVAESRMMFV